MEITNIQYHNHNQQIDFNSYHPLLRDRWKKQMTVYLPNQDFNGENFIDWDDPYKNIRPGRILDFLREFKLTK